jgi:ankyrin repeat protein
MVELLLEVRGIDPNLKDKDNGLSPLSVAVQNGRVEVVKIFLQDERVEVNLEDHDGRTPLSLAAGSGSEGMVKLLLANEKVCKHINSQDKRCQQTPLLWAARKSLTGRAEVVKLLLGKGASPDSRDTECGRTPLIWAAVNGNREMVATMLNNGTVDLDSTDTQKEWTAFRWAIEEGHEEVARSLLSGASERSSSSSQWATRSGQFLRQAASNGQKVALKLLLERDDIALNSRDEKGMTAVSLAARRGHDRIVQQLLDTGKVDINSKDGLERRTPLISAARNGREAVVKLLLARDDVDLNAKDSKGKSAETLAKDGGYDKIAGLIAEKINTTRTPATETQFRNARSQ